MSIPKLQSKYIILCQFSFELHNPSQLTKKNIFLLLLEWIGIDFDWISLIVSGLYSK